MRNTAKFKLGHYPLPLVEARGFRGVPHFSEPTSFLDSCIGTGAALMSPSEKIDCCLYGIELDADRAQGKCLRHALRGPNHLVALPQLAPQFRDWPVSATTVSIQVEHRTCRNEGTATALYPARQRILRRDK